MDVVVSRLHVTPTLLFWYGGQTRTGVRLRGIRAHQAIIF